MNLRMRTVGKTSNVVLFDLSQLEPAAAAAFLNDRAQRGCPAHAHWLVAAHRIRDVLGVPGVGGDFLRGRLNEGDRLLCPNPTGLDWNALFPSEAAAERRALAELAGPEVLVFLTDTPAAPDWLDEGPVLRASPEGLWVHHDGARLLPWSTEGGAWWIVPGQAMVSELPEGPWADVLGAGTSSRPDAPRALSPQDKKPFHAAGVLRRADNPTPLRQAVLYRSPDFPGLMDKEAVDSDETLGGIRKRQLVASMQGQTTLTEGRLGVRFQGGRLVRIESAGRTELCAGGSTYVEWGGKKRPFSMVSAFSFEGDFSWGLRQNLVLAHDDLAEPGRAVIDLYFVEESPELFAACTVRWPRWKTPETVQSWAPLELTLFNAGTLTSRCFWPEGSRDRIHRGERSGVLSGTDFVLGDKTAVVLGFPQNQTPRPHRLPWRLERGRLIVSPEGGTEPRPSSEFEGLEEHFTFYINLPEGAKLPFSPTRKQAGELIPPYVIDVDESRHS